MSYDVWLEINTGGPSPALITGTDRNYTCNIQPMLQLAGVDLPSLDGRPASDVAPIIRAALAEMCNNPEPYVTLNPSNGWGSSDGCVEFLAHIAASAELHPKATMRVSQ